MKSHFFHWIRFFSASDRAIRRRPKRLRPWVESLEDRVTPVTNTWMGGSAAWSVVGNWDQGHTPIAGEDVVIANGSTVTHSANSTPGGDVMNKITISGGSTLTLSGGTITDTTDLGVTGAGSLFKLQGGTFASANVLAGTTITGTNSGGTLNGVTVNGTLDMTGSSAQVSVTGGLTLGATGVVQIGNSAGTNIGLLSFDGSQTLGGSGSVVLGGHVGNGLRAGPTAGAALTIGPNILIHGKSGTVGVANGTYWSGSSNVTLTNQGTISADVSGGTITLNGANWSNTGVAPKGIQVAAGAGATLAGSWTNAGDISVAAPGTLNLGNSGGTWSNSGTITAAATVTLNLSGTFANPTLAGTFTTAGATVNIVSGGILTNTGTTLTLNDTGGVWRLAGGTISGGTLETTGSNALIGTNSGGTLAGGVTVNGTLDMTGSSAQVSVTGGLTLGATGVIQIGNTAGTNIGLLSFDGSQTLGGSGSVVLGGHVGNGLRVGPTAGAALTIGPNILIHGKSGTVGVANGTYWSGSSNVTLTNQGTISADVSGGTITLNGVNWSNTGVAPKGIQVAAGAGATLAGSWTNAGDISVAAPGTLNLGNSGGTWSNSGTITAAATVTLNLSGTFANPTLAGTFTTAGATVNIVSGGILTNTGTTLTLNDTGGVWRLAGGTISGGTLETTGSNALIGTNSGGTLAGGVTVNGTLDMTGSSAQVSVTGGLTLGATGVIQIGNTAGTNIGLLSFDGSQTLGGSGSVVLGGHVGNGLRVGPTAGAALTIGPNILVHGKSGTVGVANGTYWSGSSNVTLTNQGTISADVSGGTITLNGVNWSNTGVAPKGIQVAAGAGATLAGSWTNAGDISVAAPGTLNLGNSGGTWSNSGTITAAATVTLNLSGTFANPTLAGTFTTAGATVNVVSGGILTNTGTTLTLNDTGGVWRLAGGTISGGTLETTGSNALIGTNSGGTLAGGVTVNGTLDMTGSSAQVSVTGGLTLGATGVIQIGNSAGTNIGLLSFDGTQTLGGSGSVVLGGHVGNGLRVGPTAGAALTIGPNILVHGKSGTVGVANGTYWSGSSNVTLTNQGTISADVSGGTITLNGVNWSNTGVAPKGIQVAAGAGATLAGSWTNAGDISVAAPGTLNLGNSGGTWSNSGTITAAATVTLNLSGTFANPTLAGTFTTAGATVNVVSGGILTNTGTTLTLNDTGGVWRLAGGTISGGTLETTGSNALIGTNSGGTLAGGVTVNGTLDMTGSSAQVSVTGGLTLGATGVIQIGNTAGTNIGLLSFDGTQTLGGSGSVVLGGHVGNGLRVGPTAGAALTIGPNILIHGKSGTVGVANGVYWSGSSNVTFTNQGTISADVSGGTITLNGVNWSNTGTIEAAGGAITLLGTWTANGTINSAGNPTAIAGAPIGATKSGSVVTITTSAAHGFIVGQSVNIAGVGVNGYNGTFTITSVPDPTSFTYAPGAGALADSGGGTATLNSTVNLGGTFVIASPGAITSTGGVINLTGTLTNTSTTLSLPTSWRLAGGTINGGTVVMTGGASLVGTASGGTLAGVTFDGTLDITQVNGAFVAVTGGLTLANNAIVTVGSNTGFYSVLSFNGGAQTFGGSGSVLFGTNAQNTVWTGQTGGTSLTIGSGITIHGQNGVVGTNLAFLGGSGASTFTNQGVINADVAAGTIKLDGVNWSNTAVAPKGLLVATSATMTFAGSWTNSGAITAAATSTLNLAGTFTINSGTISSAGATVNIIGALTNTGATLTLNNTTGLWRLLGGTINGGTIVTTAPNALVATTSGGFLTNGVTFDGTLDVKSANGVGVTVTGGLTLANDAVVQVGSGAGLYGVLSFNGGAQTFGGSGSVLFGTNAQNTVWTGQTAGTSLTIGSGITIHGQNGVVGTNVGSLGGSAASTFTNQGIINADVAAGTIKLDGTNWTSTGAVQAQNGGTILTAGTNTNFASGTLTGGTWKAFAGSTLRIIGAAITSNAANIVLDGANSNIFNNASPGTTSALANFASNSAAGTFAVQNGRSLTTGVSFANAGSLTVGATGGASTFTVTGAYTQTNGSTTLVGGGVLASTTNSVNISAGTLQGVGSVTGAVTVGSGATLSPGAGPGLINTTGLTLNAGSTFVVEINGPNAGSGYDQTKVTGNVSLNGATLSASRLASFVPAVNTPFKIIDVTGGTVTGVFAQGSSILIDGITFDIDYAGGDGNDVVLSPQPPTVFVDDTWAGTVIGSEPTNDPIGGLVFGYNAFSDVQSGIDQAAVGSTVQVFGGTYAGAVNVNKSLAAILTATNATTTAETLVTWNGPVTLGVASILNTATADLLVNGTIDGGSGLNKAGAGILSLANANTYGGATTIQGGTLRIAADNNLGNGSSVTINGGTLQAAGTFSSVRTVTLGGLTSTINVDTSETLTLTTPIGGTGSLTKTGAGTLDLSSLVNTFGGAGQSVNVNEGILRVSADAGLGNSANALTFNGATLLASGSFTTNRDVTLNAGGGTVDTDAFSVTFASPGVIGGSGGLVKSGADTLTLAGANTYGGGTSINAGELVVSADNNLGNVSGGVTIDAGMLSAIATFPTARAFTVTNSASTIQVANTQMLTINSAIAGTGALKKVGAGTLVLTAATTYGGATTIDGGTLFVNVSTASGITVNSGGILAGNGSIDGSVTVNSGGTVSPGSATTAGLLTITGAYTQNAGAALNINVVGQATPGVTFDALAITGAASLSGAINVTIINSFSPSTNDSYAILSFASVSGDFATRTGFALGNNQFLSESFTPTALNLVVKLQPIITSADNVTLPQTLFRSFTVNATGVPTPSLSRSGALPSGVSFVDNGNGTATLSGTPVLGSLGDYPITITAANGVGNNFVQNFLLTIGIPLPVSSVDALPAFSPGIFQVSWTGTDEGGPGIASFDIFVSDNGGPFTLFQNDTTQTSAPFSGVNGHTYGFYSVATDTVGNTELPPAGAQASTQVDTIVPTSSVAALPAFSPGSFNVSWSGSDSGPSGIATYDIFVSDNGAPVTLFRNDTTQTSATFVGQDGHVYGFYSVVTDNAGNVQPTPAGAQATTEVDTAAPTSSVAVLPAFSATSFSISWSGSDVGGSGVASFDVFVSDNGGPFTLFQNDTTGTSATFTGVAGHSYAFYGVATDNIGNQEANVAIADTQTRTALYQQALAAIAEDAVAPASMKVLDLLKLHFTDVNSTVKQGIAVAQTSGNGAWQYSTDGVKWRSVGAVSLGQARLLPSTYRIRFLPAKNASGPAQLYFVGWDGSFGTAGGNIAIADVGGASPFSVDAGLVTAQVNPVNDAPTWTATALTDLLPEDTVALVAGRRIADVVGNIFSDVEGNPVGVAVVGLTNTMGNVWEFSTDGGSSWASFNTVSAAAARLLDADARIRFAGGAIFTGKATLQVRAWDGTSGTAGTTANLSAKGATGGATAFSATLLAVTAFVNAAPTLGSLTGPSLVTLEDKTSQVLAVASLHTVVAEGVAIVGATGPGTWQYTLNGTTFLPMGTVSESLARLLPSTAKARFLPAANQNGAGTLVYRAWDKSVGAAGTLFAITSTSGATAFSGNEATSALTVTPVNDAATWTATAQSVAFPNSPAAFVAGKTVAEVAASLFTDVDGNATCAIAVVGQTGNGTWEFSQDNGVVWTPLASVSAGAARLLRSTDKIHFLPNVGFSGKATIQVRAWDGSTGNSGDITPIGATGGATPFSANVLIVTAFANAAPTLGAATGLPLSTNEDKASTAVSVLSLYNSAVGGDTDTGGLKGIAVVGASSPGTWQYSTDGKTFLAMGNVSELQARLLASTAMVRFTPASNQNGQATLTYRAWDQTAGKSGSLFAVSGTGVASSISATEATSTLAITALNDAPVVNTAVKPLLTPVLPGTVPAAIPGDLVSSLLGGVTDADTGALRGLAIIAVGGTKTGTWQFQLDGQTNWQAVDNVLATSALLLGANDRIRYVPNATFKGTATLSFKAWDQTTVAAAGVKTNTTGTAFSTAFGVATALVNTAPVLNQ